MNPNLVMHEEKEAFLTCKSKKDRKMEGLKLGLEDGEIFGKEKPMEDGGREIRK